jgi:soluble lytic murein transglycosylase-like protein
VSRRLRASVALAVAFAACGAAPRPAAYAAVLCAFAPRLCPEPAGRLAELLIAESDRAGIDARLVVALVAVESGWDPGARSAAGARGLGQLMPATAAELHVDPGDPEANLRGTVAHLRRLLDRYAGLPEARRYTSALAAYNSGDAAVRRYGGVPPFAETQAYVARVIALWRQLVAA